MMDDDVLDVPGESNNEPTMSEPDLPGNHVTCLNAKAQGLRQTGMVRHPRPPMHLARRLPTLA